jgi:hypothetical protein
LKNDNKIKKMIDWLYFGNQNIVELVVNGLVIEKKIKKRWFFPLNMQKKIDNDLFICLFFWFDFEFLID